MVLCTPFVSGNGGLGDHGLVEVDYSEASRPVELQLLLGLLDAPLYLLGLFLGGYLCHLNLLLTHSVPLVYIPQGCWTNLLIRIGSCEVSRSLHQSHTNLALQCVL